MPNWWDPPQDTQSAMPYMIAGQALGQLGNIWANPGQQQNIMSGFMPMLQMKQQAADQKKKQAIIDQMQGLDPNVKAAMGLAPDAGLTAYIKNATEQQNAKDTYYSTPGGLYHPAFGEAPGGIVPGTAPREPVPALKNVQQGTEKVAVTWDPASKQWVPIASGDMWNPAVQHGPSGAGDGNMAGKGIVQIQNPDGSVSYALKSDAIGKMAPTKAQAQDQLTQKQMNEISSTDQQLAVVGSVMDNLKSDPTSFDPKKGAALSAIGVLGPSARSIAERSLFTPDQIQNRSVLMNQVSQVIHERAGTATTETEKKLLQTFLPVESDSADQIGAKMKGFEGFLTKRRGAINPVSKTNPQAQMLAPVQQPQPALAPPAPPAAPAPQPSMAGPIPKVSGAADYNALPSGATYMSPDGKTRRKP